MSRTIDRRKRTGALLSAIAMLVALMTGGSAATVAQAANSSTVKICAPAGKCINIAKSRYCPPGSTCGQQVYKIATGYCSPSVGCFTYKGRNYVYTGGPKPTAAQKSKVTQCAANLGFVWLTAVAGGPIGFTIGGATLAAWGCAS